MLQITCLAYYPIKSCRGIRADRVILGARGIENDRRWMVVDTDGRFLTQRELPRMALIEPSFIAGQGDVLCLRAPGMPDLSVPMADGEPKSVEVWGDKCTAMDCGEEAGKWLTRFLDTGCSLVYMPDHSKRQVDPRYARPGEIVGFADGFPLLLTSASSLVELNRRLDHPLPMDRFRPNLVVSGAPPFAEDDWTRLWLPAQPLSLRVVKPCARCVITTVDQATGEKQGDEPLRTLQTFRSRERKENGKPRGVLFGQNLIPDWPGKPVEIRVGDMLQVGGAV